MKLTDSLIAPGDRLREWWAGRSRVQKWAFGILQFAMVAIIAIGLNVVVGQAGLLDLGYVGFYAVGAYTVALITSPDSPWNRLSPNGLLSTPWAWLSCVPLAMAIT